jgi:hypothetical protein
VLPDPTPTAGTEPTSFPVVVSLPPNSLVEVPAVSVTMLGNPADDVVGAAS